MHAAQARDRWPPRSVATAGLGWGATGLRDTQPMTEESTIPDLAERLAESRG